MTNLTGSALPRRTLMYLILWMGLAAPVWLAPLLESRPAPETAPARATISSSPLAGCAEATAAFAGLPRTLPGGPAARGLEGTKQLVQPYEAFRSRTAQLVEAPSANADSSRMRAVEISRIDFALSVRSASTGSDSDQTTALPPPLSA